MLHNGRRVVVASWAFAREQFAALVTERNSLKRELAETEQRLIDVERERDEALAHLRELQAITLERSRAYHELRSLQRERDLVRARNAQRGPGPLQ
jgi:uncharacterized protein (DUF3084 family)